MWEENQERKAFDYVRYFEEPNGLKVVALPYRGKTRAVVILPPESQSVASCIIL